MRSTDRFLGLRPILTCLALTLATLAHRPARAEFILSVESVAATPGASGVGLDVLLRNTGPDAVQIDGFSFGLSAAPAIDLIRATTATVAPYIFAGHSLFGPDITVQAGSPLLAADLFDIPNGAITLAANSTVSLGRVLLDITPAASGIYSIAFSVPDTGLSYQGGDLPIGSFEAGTITLTAVPEPSGLLLGSIGLLASWPLLRARRRVAR